MRFFFDNNLSAKLAHGMREFGEDVVHLTDHFPQDAVDSEWLPFVGENQLILVTRDEKNSLEAGRNRRREVIQNCRLLSRRQETDPVRSDRAGREELAPHEASRSNGTPALRHKDSATRRRIQTFTVVGGAV